MSKNTNKIGQEFLKRMFNSKKMNKINELMHGQKKRLLSTVHSYIVKGMEHASRQSASWFFYVFCPLAGKFWGWLTMKLIPLKKLHYSRNAALTNKIFELGD